MSILASISKPNRDFDPFKHRRSILIAKLGRDPNLQKTIKQNIKKSRKK